MIRPNIKFFTNRLLILCIISLPIVTSCDYFRAPKTAQNFSRVAPIHSPVSHCAAEGSLHTGKTRSIGPDAPLGPNSKPQKLAQARPSR